MKHPQSTLLFICLASVCVTWHLSAQAKADEDPGSDVLIFANGEKLIGHLQTATDINITFKSQMAGSITVEWTKVQELQTTDKFAVVPKAIKLRRFEDTAAVGKGTVRATDKQIEVAVPQGAPQTVPVSDIGNVVNAAAFENAFQRHGLTSGWKGGATVGIALTEATQKNQTFTSAINMVRATPAESWLNLRSRTIVEFNQAYGKLTQPGSPAIKTDLLHAGAEQDWYFSPRVFAFGRAVFDHSFSQGLDLQQEYGGGLGFVVLKGLHEELDFKASVDYINQQFQIASRNQQLFGSSFSETFTKTFARNILFNEQAGITPAWNNTDAYSAFASAALTFPVYRRFGLTIAAIDNFLNNPPPAFKKNSFQLTVGATYSF